jgi:hypothetical protein
MGQQRESLLTLSLHATPTKGRTAMTTIIRPATLKELAAYKAAVAPLLGDPRAIEKLRVKMKVFMKSGTLLIKTRRNVH